MNAGIADKVQELLTASLPAWRLTGSVAQVPDGTLLVIVGDERFRIARHTGDLPFRWMVTHGDRTRGVASVAGLLRSVRAAADPSYRPVRLRVAPLPPIPAPLPIPSS